MRSKLYSVCAGSLASHRLKIQFQPGRIAAVGLRRTRAMADASPEWRSRLIAKVRQKVPDLSQAVGGIADDFVEHLLSSRPANAAPAPASPS